MMHRETANLVSVQAAGMLTSLANKATSQKCFAVNGSQKRGLPSSWVFVSNLEVDFYLDIHAHSTLMNGFIYGNIYEDIERCDRQAVFPKLLGSNAEDFSLSNTSFNRDPVKAGTGRRTFGGSLDGSSYCYTMEVSFFSYQTAGGQTMPYTEEAYLKLGRNIARTFLDYYKLMGYISIKPSSGLTVKPQHEQRSKRGSVSDTISFINDTFKRK